MKPRSRTSLLLWSLSLFLAATSGAAQPGSQSAAAHDFLALLDDKQRPMAARPWLSPARTEWTYFPWGHTGLALSDLSEPQKQASFALLASGLSEQGEHKALQVVALEADEVPRGFLSRFWADPEAYHTTIFGVPGPANLWSWRFEGHHLSINLSHANGKIVSGTPYFIGADPARVEDGPLADMAILEQEESLARALYLSLDQAQQQQAMVGEEAPDDILTGNATRAELACCEGLPASAMHPGQYEELFTLMELILGQLDATAASIHRQRIYDAGKDNITFAWAGSSEPGKPHYYRIQGPTILIEYDNTQDGANHVHLVLRDPELDFGGDPLHADNR